MKNSYYENLIPEDMPTYEEMWQKLTGTSRSITLEEFQAIVDKAVGK